MAGQQCNFIFQGFAFTSDSVIDAPGKGIDWYQEDSPPKHESKSRRCSYKHKPIGVHQFKKHPVSEPEVRLSSVAYAFGPVNVF